MYGYFVDLRTCGGYFADRRPQLGPQNTHWLVRRSAGPQVRKIPEAPRPILQLFFPTCFATFVASLNFCLLAETTETCEDGDLAETSHY